MSDENRETRVGGGVFRLMYRSRDLVPPEDRADELGDLFAKSRSDNKKRDITGALLVSRGAFVQVLEGDEATVRSLFSTIAKDSRHDDVEVLAEGHAGRRTFEHWSMGEVTLADSALPLIATVSEIRGGRPVNAAEQDRVLAVMREALDEAGRDDAADSCE
jgi:hypothetical protein